MKQTMPNSDRSARAVRRQEERMQRRGLVLPSTDLPKTQVLLLQVIQQNQGIITLLETLCRAALGQSADDIARSQGITFPVISEEAFKKALEDAAMAKMDEQAAEEEAAVATV